MNSVLITGASGFIGAALARDAAANPDNKVAIILRDTEVRNEWLSKLSNVTLLRGDITDFKFLRRVIADQEVNTVFHCAAQSIVRICAQDPISAYETNVMGTVNLLEAVRQVGMPHIKSIVVSTSDKAYGHAKPPYDENTPLQPKYTYEATKSCQDIVAQNYFWNYGLPVKIARCSNVYGPGDPNNSRLIPNTIRKLLNNERPQIYTDVMDYKREFVYIDDVVDAFNLINKTGIDGFSYCVGGTGMHMVIDVVHMIHSFIHSDGRSPPIDFIDRTSNFKEIAAQWIDASRLLSLGWDPKVDLKEGLRRTINYYASQQ